MEGYHFQHQSYPEEMYAEADCIEEAPDEPLYYALPPMQYHEEENHGYLVEAAAQDQPNYVWVPVRQEVPPDVALVPDYYHPNQMVAVGPGIIHPVYAVQPFHPFQAIQMTIGTNAPGQIAVPIFVPYFPPEPVRPYNEMLSVDVSLEGAPPPGTVPSEQRPSEPGVLRICDCHTETIDSNGIADEATCSRTVPFNRENISQATNVNGERSGHNNSGALSLPLGTNERLPSLRRSSVPDLFTETVHHESNGHDELYVTTQRTSNSDSLMIQLPNFQEAFESARQRASLALQDQAMPSLTNPNNGTDEHSENQFRSSP